MLDQINNFAGFNLAALLNEFDEDVMNLFRRNGLSIVIYGYDQWEVHDLTKIVEVQYQACNLKIDASKRNALVISSNL